MSYTANTHTPHDDQQNAQSATRLAIIMAICFALSAMAPPGLVLATFSSLLFVGAMVSMLAGTLRREPLFAPHLTRWDEAAAFLIASIVTAWLVDVDQVRQITEGVPGP